MWFCTQDIRPSMAKVRMTCAILGGTLKWENAKTRNRNPPTYESRTFPCKASGPAEGFRIHICPNRRSCPLIGVGGVTVNAFLCVPQSSRNATVRVGGRHGPRIPRGGAIRSNWTFASPTICHSGRTCDPGLEAPYNRLFDPRVHTPQIGSQHPNCGRVLVVVRPTARRPG